MKTLIGVVLFSIPMIGCFEDMTTKQREATAVAIQKISSQKLIVAYTSSEFALRLSDVSSDNPPKGFHWVKFELSPTQQANLRQGIQIDFGNKLSEATFEQTYPGPCNPAKNDFSTCWLHERYVAGDERFRGSLSLKVADDKIEGAFDVTWEGLTDRFGEPLQQHQHGTEGQFRASVINTGAVP